MDLKETAFKNMNWIQLAYDRAQGRALVITETNLHVKCNLRISLQVTRFSSGTIQ
jgi:hypothetical protein